MEHSMSRHLRPRRVSFAHTIKGSSQLPNVPHAILRVSAIRSIDFAQSAIVHLQWMRTTRHIVCSSHTSEFSINSANAAVWHCKSDWPTGPTDHTHTQSRYHQQDANVLTPNRSQTYANTLIGSLKRYTTLIVHIYKWQQQPRSHLTENHQCSVCSFVSLFFCFFFLLVCRFCLFGKKSSRKRLLQLNGKQCGLMECKLVVRCVRNRQRRQMVMPMVEKPSQREPFGVIDKFCCDLIEKLISTL